MRISKVAVYKIIAALVVFAASLPFTILYANATAGHYSLVAIWLIALAMINKREFIGRLYFLLFGIFFVLPPAIANETSFLSAGQFFKNISLDPPDILKMQISVFIFLAAFTACMLLLQRKATAVSEVRPFRLRKIGLLYALLLLSFLIVIRYNIREAQAVFSQGYQEYFAGDLTVQKGLGVLFIEYTFIILALFGISAGRILPFTLLAIYATTLVLSGQRMPGAILLIVLSATAFPNGLFQRHFFFFCFLGFGVAPPFMMIIQTLRAVGVSGLTKIDLVFFFKDFWAVIGGSLDTLKVAVISDRISGVDVNLFARLNLTLNVVFSRVFGIQLDLNTNGFGASFSKYLSPDLFYDKHVTFASSGIAESYFIFGFFGVALYAAAAALISKRFQTKMISRRPLALLTLYVFAPRFLVGVRNELFGWIFEGAIYFVTMYPIYRLLKMLFVRTTSLKLNSESSSECVGPEAARSISGK